RALPPADAQRRSDSRLESRWLSTWWFPYRRIGALPARTPLQEKRVRSPFATRLARTRFRRQVLPQAPGAGRHQGSAVLAPRTLGPSSTGRWSIGRLRT